MSHVLPVREAVEASDPQLGRIADALVTRLEMIEEFPEVDFKELLDLFGSPAFSSCQGAWHVLAAVERSWHLLTDAQRTRLLGVLERIYPLLEDRLAWFVISELFGEYARDRRALDALVRLRSVGREDPRSLLPHGFEHLYKAAGDVEVRQAAWQQLLDLTHDVSAVVRDEALLSLERIASPRPAGDQNTQGMSR